MNASAHRLPVTMRTVFQDLILATYSVPPQHLAALLPPTLHPYVRDGRSFVSIVVGNLRGMRPSVLPEVLGTNYYQIVYRAVVRLHTRDGQELPGVYFLRSDGNDPVMSFFGNRLTEFRFHFFHTGAINLYRYAEQVLVAAESRDGGGDLVIHARDCGPAEKLPAAALFHDFSDERRHLVELFHAYAHDTRTGAVYDLEIERGDWHPRRLHILGHFSAFFSEAPFRCHDSDLVSALYIQECSYIWKPMISIDLRHIVARDNDAARAEAPA